MQWNPADGEQNEDQGQGAGQPPLPEQGGPSLGVALLQACLQTPEESSVEEDHEQQRCQDTPQEVKVDHEGEGHDGEEGAGGRRRQTGGIRRRRGVVVPAQQRREPQ